MFLGVSRDTWVQVWTALMLALISAGVAMLILAAGLDAADQPNHALWYRYGVIAIITGLIGLVMFISFLWFIRPRDTQGKEPPSLWLRLIRNLWRVRVFVKPIDASAKPPQQLLQEAEAQIERLQVERRDLKGKIDELRRQYSDEHREASAAIQARDLARNAVKERAVRIAELEPVARWAQKMIDDARGKEPFMLARPDAWLDWDAAVSLKKNEPWFDLHIELEYKDVHRLIVGETVSGALARWNGEKFNHEPICFAGEDELLPYDRVGRSILRLRVHQRVTPASATSILEALRKHDGPNSAIIFDASALCISVRVLSAPNDQLLYEGALRLGSELATRYTLQE